MPSFKTCPSLSFLKWAQKCSLWAQFIRKLVSWNQILIIEVKQAFFEAKPSPSSLKLKSLYWAQTSKTQPLSSVVDLAWSLLTVIFQRNPMFVPPLLPKATGCQVFFIRGQEMWNNLHRNSIKLTAKAKAKLRNFNVGLLCKAILRGSATTGN